jgi:L-ascorbate metabolism protein UlaG (beta-lactamase superfamily)
MRISKFIHSCVLIEEADSRILFDPGKFCFVEGLVQPGQFQDLTAILLSHGQPDHLDAGSLRKILDANPQAELLTNKPTATELASSGIRASLFEEGERTIGDFRVTAVAALHAPILGGEPPSNTAFLVNDMVLSPGDSFSSALDRFASTPVLLLPIMAPWEGELEMWAFAQRMRPQVVIPVHDGQAKPFFVDHRYEFLAEEFDKVGIRFISLKRPGGSYEFAHA